MAVGNSSAIGSVEVRVVHSDLSEICVRWTKKRVWKNEMQKYARGRHMSFSGTDRFRVAGRREDLCGESSEEREWIWPGSADEWKGAFISKCRSKRGQHLRRELGILLLPPFCCLIRLCKLQVMACPRDFHYHFCVAD